MILPQQLIEKFQYALDNHWGYIYATSYETWTQAKQNALVKKFETKYGSNWKNNETAKKADKYYGALYGAKWIGHIVTDCSGLFYWAFKQLGGYMYHGSNTMWDKYCTAQGVLTTSGRTDGKELKPGTAVFTGNASNKGHVGLYIGNNKVIEASGTIAGVISTTITGGKWKYWGELKGVDYDNASAPAEDEEPVSTQSALVNAARVALREAPSTNASIIVRVNQGERVQVLDDTAWTKVTYQGKTGYMMTKFLTI